MTKTFFLDPSSPTYYEDKARQGHAFRLADDVRVTRLVPEGEEHKVVEGGLEEVKNDGTEIGEIVMRGNLVMKVRALELSESSDRALTQPFLSPTGLLQQSCSDDEGFCRWLLPLRRSRRAAA